MQRFCLHAVTILVHKPSEINLSQPKCKQSDLTSYFAFSRQIYQRFRSNQKKSSKCILNSWAVAKKIQLQSTKINKFFVIASSAKIVAIQQKTNVNKDGSCKDLQVVVGYNICTLRSLFNKLARLTVFSRDLTVCREDLLRTYLWWDQLKITCSK